MRIEDHLTKEQKKQLESIKSPKNKHKLPDLNDGGKTVKPMSRKDWEEIMGTRRETYKRVNGAVRRK